MNTYVHIKDLIVNLTQKKEERINNVDKVIGVLYHLSTTGVPANVITSEEFKGWLHSAKRGSKVVLGEGVYEGKFRVVNIEILGDKGGGTVLSFKMGTGKAC